jgi:hypothetical protein
VSDGGGDWPRWRKDGKELFYHSIGITPNPGVAAVGSFVGPLFSVSVSAAGTTFEHAPPKAVLNMYAFTYPHSGGDYHTYAVSPDGQKFLYFQFVPPAAAATTASGPDHQSGLMIAIDWAAALGK